SSACRAAQTLWPRRSAASHRRRPGTGSKPKKMEEVMKGFNQIATSTMLAAGLLALPISGMAAEGLSYGYLEIDYVNLDVDEPGDDVFDRDFDNGGGWGIQASVPLTDTFFIFGGYSDTEADFSF